MNKKEYDHIEVDALTFIKTDKDGSDDGKVYAYDGDCSFICENIDPDELVEIKQSDEKE